MNPELQQLFRAFEATYTKLDARLTRIEERLGITPDDPFTGHPELSLDAEPDEAEDRWAVAEPEDPTLRVLPWGELPAPPPTPDGKVWVNRGTFLGNRHKTRGREVRFFADGKWEWTILFFGDFPHIELVDAPL